jgi:hypothetical protein
MEDDDNYIVWMDLLGHIFKYISQRSAVQWRVLLPAENRAMRKCMLKRKEPLGLRNRALWKCGSTNRMPHTSTWWQQQSNACHEIFGAAGASAARSLMVWQRPDLGWGTFWHYWRRVRRCQQSAYMGRCKRSEASPLIWCSNWAVALANECALLLRALGAGSTFAWLERYASGVYVLA